MYACALVKTVTVLHMLGIANLKEVLSSDIVREKARYHSILMYN